MQYSREYCGLSWEAKGVKSWRFVNPAPIAKGEHAPKYIFTAQFTAISTMYVQTTAVKFPACRATGDA